MKYLLFIPLLFVSLFVNHPVYAQAIATPTFFCVGTNPQPPCVTISPSRGQVTISPAVSSNPTISPPVTTQSPTITPPCGTTQSMNHAMSVKAHAVGGQGLLRQFFQFLIQLLQLLFQLLGGGSGPQPNPNPTPIPTENPIPTLAPTTGNPSVVPTSNPTTTVPTPMNPCPTATPAVSTAPTTGVSPTSVMNPTPTIFGVSPTPVSATPTTGATNCQPNAILVNPCRPWFGAAANGNSNAAADPISQFTFLEGQIGHQMDIFHDYHPAGNLPLNSDEIHFATRANTYSFVNWKPAGNWASAGGGDTTVNANIDKAAANIKAIAPHKIFLTIWHEPENDVTPGTSSCPNLKGSAGSPAQYRAMWQNVENRFKADGVTNVVWVMVYQGYEPFDCLKPELWPGNSLVDWVAYDTYGTDAKPNWNDSVGRVYKLLQADQSSTTDFASKPWAVAEYGTCNMTNEQNAYTYYQSAKAALDANAYPNIKMYLIYADTGNNAGPGCLTDFTKAGAADPTKQMYFNQFANDPIFLKH